MDVTHTNALESPPSPLRLYYFNVEGRDETLGWTAGVYAHSREEAVRVISEHLDTSNQELCTFDRCRAISESSPHVHFLNAWNNARPVSAADIQAPIWAFFFFGRNTMEVIASIDLYQCNPATNTDKQYRVQLEQHAEGYACIGYNGRRGARLKPQGKVTGADLTTARKAYDQLVSKKIKEGYTPDSSGVAYTGTDLAGRDSGLRAQLLTEIDEEWKAHALLSDPAWGMQQKMDGERILISKVGNAVTGANRKGLSVPLPEPLVADLLTIENDFTLDGEFVKGRIYAFDLLECDGRDLRRTRYDQRYAALAGLLSLKRELVQIVPLYATSEEKTRIYNSLKDFAEGVVFKDLSASWSEGYVAHARKFKFYATASVIVAAHNEQRSVAMALLNDAGAEVPVGNVTVKANQDIPAIGAIIEVKYLYAVDSLVIPEILAVRTDIDRSECTLAQLKYKPDTTLTA